MNEQIESEAGKQLEMLPNTDGAGKIKTKKAEPVLTPIQPVIQGKEAELLSELPEHMRVLARQTWIEYNKNTYFNTIVERVKARDAFYIGIAFGVYLKDNLIEHVSPGSL